MIVTLTVSRSRASRRRPWWRHAATGAVLALLLGSASPAVAAATPDPTATTTSAAPSMTLVPVANGVVQTGSAVAVSVTVRGSTSPSNVSLAMGDQPLPDRAALSSWIAGNLDGVAVTEIGGSALEAAGAGETANASIAVAADDPRLAGRAAGVYPIVATTTIDGAALVSTSALVFADAGPGAAGLGIVVPITAPAISRGLLTSDQLAELTAADGSLTAQLDAVAGTRAILAVDPAIPAAIRVLGETAPVTAGAWLDRLLALPNSRFALQFGDADLAVQIHAGLTQPLNPTSLISYLPAGTTPATADPTDTPTPGGAPLLPDLAALTDIGEGRQGVYWPISATSGPAVIGALGALGTPDAPAMTLVPSASTSAGSEGALIGARVDSGASALLAYDSTISELLRTAADASDTSTRDSALAAATAQLAFVDAGTPVLVTVDRGQDRSRANLRATIEAATTAPGVAAVSLSEITAAAASASVDVTDLPAEAARVGDLSSLLADEASLSRFATILDDPALLTGRERAEILQLLGAAWGADASPAIAEHRAATASTLDSVGILASGSINLLSYGSVYRPFVRNDLPWPVNVTLVAQPDDPRLIVQTRTTSTAGPASNTRFEVPVQAQIANGQVTVAMYLLSPTGEQIGAPQSIGVEVHAEWEAIGLSVLGGLLVLFIGVGIARTVLRRRAARAATAEGAEVAE